MTLRIVQCLIFVTVLLPLLPAWGYFSHFKPGGGPQGGELVVLMMLLYASSLAVIALAGGIRITLTTQGAWWLRFVVRPVLPILAVITGLWLLAALPNLLVQHASGFAKMIAAAHGLCGVLLILTALILPWRR